MRFKLILALVAVALIPVQALAQTADTILINGNIITVDERKPKAVAVAIEGGRILAVGSNEEINRLRNSRTRVIDLRGKTVIPGLIDGHLHFVGLGAGRGSSLELGEAKSEADVAAQVRRAVARAKPGEWITGDNWHTGNWDRETWPTKKSLDEAAPNNPVLLRGMHGHASWANSKAFEITGINRTTPDPLGGKILRDDETREATGILIENAQALVRDKITGLADAPIKEQIKKSVQLALSYGFVGAHDMGTTLEAVAAYKELIDAGEFPFRMNAIPRVVNAGALLDQILQRGVMAGYGDHRLTVRGVKVSIDGALGSRGAALMSPYEDEPHNIGVIRVPYDQLYFIVEKSLKAGFNVAIHAIGDRGNQMALDSVEEALRRVPTEGHRIRIEHAQVVRREDLSRFGELGLLASVQWMHCTLDMPWAEKRVGRERIRSSYAWRTLLNHGTRLVGGSDEGAATFSPFMGIHAAVTRQDSKGWPEGGWYSEQALTRYEALKSYTLDAAYASFEEAVMGSITPGKLADIVVISKDIMTVPAAEILQTQVVMTMVGGRVVFERKEN
ncbi:MAG: amidohydrolase [Blastocatellia bacterium]|nr:amidohydrolase [Blastocatellia bacterium]